jgi:hypothetical protein
VEKMENTKMLDLIMEALEEMEIEKLVSIHNERCYDQNYYDDEIFYNDDDFFNTYYHNKVIEAVRAVTYGDYRYTDEYMRYNGYGNLVSMTEWEVGNWIDKNEVAEWMIENDKMQEFDIEIDEEEEEEE